MSGSGNGSNGGSPGSSTRCQDINTITHIATPNPQILEKVKVGDYLDLTLRTSTGPIQAVTNTGEIVGSILTVTISQLINCINEGVQFHAKVLSKNGGDCKVLITPK